MEVTPGLPALRTQNQTSYKRPDYALLLQKIEPNLEGAQVIVAQTSRLRRWKSVWRVIRDFKILQERSLRREVPPGTSHRTTHRHRYRLPPHQIHSDRFDS